MKTKPTPTPLPTTTAAPTRLSSRVRNIAPSPTPSSPPSPQKCQAKALNAAATAANAHLPTLAQINAALTYHLPPRSPDKKTKTKPKAKNSSTARATASTALEHRASDSEILEAFTAALAGNQGSKGEHEVRKALKTLAEAREGGVGVKKVVDAQAQITEAFASSFSSPGTEKGRGKVKSRQASPAWKGSVEKNGKKGRQASPARRGSGVISGAVVGPTRPTSVGKGKGKGKSEGCCPGWRGAGRFCVWLASAASERSGRGEEGEES